MPPDDTGVGAGVGNDIVGTGAGTGVGDVVGTGAGTGVGDVVGTGAGVGVDVGDVGDVAGTGAGVGVDVGVVVPSCVIPALSNAVMSLSNSTTLLAFS